MENGCSGASQIELPNLSSRDTVKLTWFPTSGDSEGITDTCPVTAAGEKSAFTMGLRIDKVLQLLLCST